MLGGSAVLEATPFSTEPGTHLTRPHKVCVHLLFLFLLPVSPLILALRSHFLLPNCRLSSEESKQGRCHWGSGHGTTLRATGPETLRAAPRPVTGGLEGTARLPPRPHHLGSLDLTSPGVPASSRYRAQNPLKETHCQLPGSLHSSFGHPSALELS